MGVSFVQAYVVSNVLLVGALGFVALVMRWSASTLRPLSFRQQLLFAYALMTTAVIAPWFAMTSQSADFLPTTAQVWAAPSMDAATVPALDGGHATISFTSENAGLSLDSVSRVTLMLCLVGLAVATEAVWLAASSGHCGSFGALNSFAGAAGCACWSLTKSMCRFRSGCPARRSSWCRRHCSCARTTCGSRFSTKVNITVRAIRGCSISCSCCVDCSG